MSSHIDLSDDEFRRYAAELPAEYPPGHADYVLSMRDQIAPDSGTVRVWLDGEYEWPETRYG